MTDLIEVRAEAPIQVTASAARILLDLLRRADAEKKARLAPHLTPPVPAGVVT